RFRYDQVQKLGWRMLLPIGLANVFVSGALVLLDPSLRYLALVGLLEIAILVSLVAYKPAPATKAVEAPAHGGPVH
ncbi:MAG: NADH-quinone oxidoreductase subunit H, partial [Deltaproteobacteria bacterium]|nr:NADH-quinone oxidoreductase subunit H [Deltaproteobacteria bacterium]